MKRIDDIGVAAYGRGRSLNRGAVAEAVMKCLETGISAYAIVGDSREFPEEIPTDIDVAIPEKELTRARARLGELCHRLGMAMVQVIRHYNGLCCVFCWYTPDGSPEFLAIDLNPGYRLHGSRILDDEVLLAGRVRPPGKAFFVPGPAEAFALYLLKKVVKQDLDASAGAYLSGCWNAASDDARRLVGRYWDGEDLEIIARAAVTGDWSGVRGRLPEIRRALVRRCGGRLRGAVADIPRLAGRILRPNGLCVAVLGPDGSGKSAMIDAVIGLVAPAFRRHERFHLRPSFRRRPANPVTEPHALPARGLLASLAKLVFFVVAYNVGWIARVRPSTMRSGLVMFDRYYHDLVVDPKRFRYGGPMWLARMAAGLIPAPDLWIVLDAPGEVLQKRKAEVPSAESERQRLAYRALADRLGNTVVIDAAQPLELVALEAARAILARMDCTPHTAPRDRCWRSGNDARRRTQR